MPRGQLSPRLAARLDHPHVVPILQNINTAYNPETIHNPIEAEYKEFDTGRRYPWAYDRVM